MNKAAQQVSKTTRLYRKLHHWIAIPLFAFMFIMGVTGFLLGWKKDTGLLPKTAQGSSTVSGTWIPVDSLVTIAQNFALNNLFQSGELDRVDIRPDKGIAKMVYKQHFSEIQLDLQTGEILNVQIRYSDILEKIHDGSILDHLFDTRNGEIKLIFITIISLGLILLSFSGFWLWFNPIRIRKIKSKSQE